MKIMKDPQLQGPGSRIKTGNNAENPGKQEKCTHPCSDTDWLAQPPSVNSSPRSIGASWMDSRNCPTNPGGWKKGGEVHN